MEEAIQNKEFTHSKYTKTIGWYLLINGLIGLGYGGFLVSLGVEFANKITFGFAYILIPCASSLIGYYVVIRQEFALEFSRLYFITGIPILGIETWQYTFAHGLSVDFKIEAFGMLLGINILPFVGLWLLTKHYNQ